MFHTQSRYAVGSDETQACFTAKQQRDGVCILPHIFAGLFGRQGGNPAANVGGTQDSADAADDPEPAADDQVCDADDDEEVDKVKRGFTYDWGAYRSTFGDTPLHEAVTALFAEYATLYMRIAGQVGASVPPPLTRDVAQDISEHATRFVLDYVTPILGQLNGTKFHRLLCHVLQAIKMHGNLRNGHTAANESQHKEDKVFYSRTTKHPASFTAQLVRQAQGSRAMLEALEQQDADAKRAAASAGPGAARVGGATASGRRGRAASTTLRARRDAAVARRASRNAAATEGGAQRPAASHHLAHETVAKVAQRPGLGNLPSLLGLQADYVLPVLGYVRIPATFDCGTRAPQIVRASRSFREAPWLDAVIYSVGEDKRTVFVGEVRALLRRPHGDIAVVCEMEPVSAVFGCPLAARGCTRLKWLRRPGGVNCSLRVVPVKDFRRVAHVVPDFRDLDMRRGVGAAPAGELDPLDQRLAMRFFLNAFYPWEVPR